MRAILLVSLYLAARPALGSNGPTEIIDESQNPESRAAWNIAIMKALVGAPDSALDARQRGMIKKLKELGREINPLPEGSDRRQLQARLSDDEMRYNTILSMRDPYSGSYDKKAMKALTDPQKDLIGKYWGIANGQQSPPPPAVPPPGADIRTDDPANPTGQGPGSQPGSNPFGGPAGSPGGFDPGGPGAGGPRGAAPNGGLNGQAPDLERLRGNVDKALGAAKDGAGSFDRKEDDLNAAPKPAGPPGQPGPQGQAQRTIQRGPEIFAPGRSPRPAAHDPAPDLHYSPSSGGAAPPSFAAGIAPPASRKSRPGFTPDPSTREIARAAGGPAAEGPGMARPGTSAPSMAPLRGAKPAEKKDLPGEESLSPEELAAIKEIQEMLAAASGDAPLDTDALQNGADKLDGAAAGSAWKGVDINALSRQIRQIVGMAGVQGTWSQQQVVYQAAANLGLSDMQAGRIIKALRISEPPSPRLNGLTWWQRFLAWARYYKRMLVRRLV